MRVLKVVAEGLTTSFRRPFLMVGIQPTFRMPPPSTIYGHICSTLGEVISPVGIAFAYHFTFKAIFRDVEHIHLVAASGGKLPGTEYPKVQEGSINPYIREQLFRPRLVLYLNRPEWIDAFRSPHYAVVLGRSQDLFSYLSVEIIELHQGPSAYFEHTLLPYSMAVQTGMGAVELLPRYLDYEHNRAPNSERYLLLEHRVYSEEFLRFASDQPSLYWVDPTSPREKGVQLGLIFHTFVEGESDGYDVLA